MTQAGVSQGGQDGGVGSQRQAEDLESTGLGYKLKEGQKSAKGRRSWGGRSVGRNGSCSACVELEMRVRKLRAASGRPGSRELPHVEATEPVRA